MNSMAAEDWSPFTLEESWDDSDLLDQEEKDAFVLGVEWMLVRNKLYKDDDNFTVFVHARNVERIKQLCRMRGRRATFTATSSTYWIHVHVLGIQDLLKSLIHNANYYLAEGVESVDEDADDDLAP